MVFVVGFQHPLADVFLLPVVCTGPRLHLALPVPVMIHFSRRSDDRFMIQTFS